ncbi:hypothetical protein AAFF_G00074710 [Aldrovandia affinis]|uniref:Uncharacterized protein n=1 Tax=Aldrovandia affinis TaxID=143900 RepID=A0AAD7WDD3_9TELE|nr:hypothetical protein AAFF_G00074710 [Aldrovandia affinis]
MPFFAAQVLHLMNKMNLPSPVGPVTARPPMYELIPAPPPPHLTPRIPSIEEKMEFSSEEESEYENHDEERKQSGSVAAPIFEQPQICRQKEIEFHISADEPGDGFEKICPTAQVAQEEDSDEDEDIPSEFISRRELEKRGLSRDEIKRMSVFKTYEPGDPTWRLIKNIAKQVEERGQQRAVLHY